MEKFFVRAFGLVWIGMIAFLSCIVSQDPMGSGMAIGFILMCAGLSYYHFSGEFDPPTKENS